AGTVNQTDGSKLIFANGTVLPNSVANVLDNLTLNGDLDLRNGGRVLVRNGLVLSGSVFISNTGVLSFNGIQTFNTGSVIFEGDTGYLGVERDSTLTLGPAMIVRGKSGTIGQSFFVTGNTKLINQGLISANTAGGTLTINPTVFENTGTLEELNGGKIVIR